MTYAGKIKMEVLVSSKYNQQALCILTALQKEVELSCEKYKHLNSTLLANHIKGQIELSVRQIISNHDIRFSKLLNGLIPKYRGKEECDCSNQNKCGCKVDDFNDMIDEVTFAVNLLKSTMEE